MNKELKKLLARLLAEGIVTGHSFTGGGHIRLALARGGFYVMAASPRCPYAYKNAEKDIRRMHARDEAPCYTRDSFKPGD